MSRCGPTVSSLRTKSRVVTVKQGFPWHTKCQAKAVDRAQCHWSVGVRADVVRAVHRLMRIRTASGVGRIISDGGLTGFMRATRAPRCPLNEAESEEYRLFNLHEALNRIVFLARVTQSRWQGMICCPKDHIQRRLVPKL